MNFTFDWLLRSLAVGGIAAACVFACPSAWRGRIRRAVPAAAFFALLVSPLAIFAPVKIHAPAAFAGLAAAPVMAARNLRCPRRGMGRLPRRCASDARHLGEDAPSPRRPRLHPQRDGPFPPHRAPSR